MNNCNYKTDECIICCFGFCKDLSSCERGASSVTSPMQYMMHADFPFFFDKLLVHCKTDEEAVQPGHK